MYRYLSVLAFLMFLLAACGTSPQTPAAPGATLVIDATRTVDDLAPTPTPWRTGANLKSIKVTPASGKGPFTLTATYEPGPIDDAIGCFYIAQTPGGGRGEFEIPVAKDSTGTFAETELTHEFTIDKLGTYRINCWEASSNRGIIDTVANFTVTE